MKHQNISVSAALIIAAISFSCKGTETITIVPSIRVPVVSAEDYLYFGQTPPGFKAELLAPGFINTDNQNERDMSFSADLKEVYFSRRATIMTSRLEGSKWTEPAVASFSGDYFEFEAFLMPSGKRLYYISRRPLSGTGDPEAWQLWYVERTVTGWGSPSRLNDAGDYFPTFTTSGTMYFTDAHEVLFKGEIVADTLATREKLGDNINSGGREYNSFIAPDESYLIFTSHGWGDGFGAGDLFISYRNDDGSWTKAKNMGLAINSSSLDYCPSVSPDGKYFFFTSRKAGTEDIYWIDAGIIDLLRDTDMNLADDLYNAATVSIEDAVNALDDAEDNYTKYRTFDGDVILSVAKRLIGDGKSDVALEFIRSSLDLFPDWSLDLLLVLQVAATNDPTLTVKPLEVLKARAAADNILERRINALGYQILDAQQKNVARSIFRLNIDLFPEAANVYDSYGEILLMQGDTTASITNYKRSLELNPENQNAADVLKTLGVE